MKPAAWSPARCIKVQLLYVAIAKGLFHRTNLIVYIQTGGCRIRVAFNDETLVTGLAGGAVDDAALQSYI
jgi:hypothetical protein